MPKSIKKIIKKIRPIIFFAVLIFLLFGTSILVAYQSQQWQQKVNGYVSTPSALLVTPTLYCLGSCPSGTPTIAPTILPTIQPTIIPPGNISPTVDPCAKTVSTNISKSEQVHYPVKRGGGGRGWFGGFFQQLFNFLQQLLLLLFQLLGQNPTPLPGPISPTPTMPNPLQPSITQNPAQPSPTPNPCPTNLLTPTIFGHPTSTPQPVPTAIVNPTPTGIQPTQGAQGTLPGGFQEDKGTGTGHDWQAQPKKAALMIFHAHPDDEGGNFGGTLTYYSVVKKVPVVGVSMTDGGAGNNPSARPQELANAYWAYGMRNPPIIGPFPDCCYGQTIDAGWQAWGGQDNVVRITTELIRYFKPDVILGHAFDGEYGHPNHMTSAYAVSGACDAAGDPNKYPDQVAKYGTWQVKKCYIHNYNQNQITMDWTTPDPALNGQSPYDLTVAGMAFHVSQGKLGSPRSSTFGLYKTLVGPDVKKNDFLENIDLSQYP